MSRQRFGDQCVLVALLKDTYGISHDSFSFSQSILGQKSSSPRFIDLSDRSRIAQAEKKVASAIEMLVCFLILSDCEEQITKIVFDTSESACVSRLLIVET